MKISTNRKIILTATFALLFSGCTTTGNYSIAPCRVCPPVIPDNTLVIFIGAFPDLGKWGRVPQLAGQFHNCGVNAVFFEPWDHFGDHKLVANAIRTAVRCRGQRVMIVAWSYGAVTGLKALKILEPEGVCVDTFMEIDCFNLKTHMWGDVQRRNVRRNVVVRSAFNNAPKEYGRYNFYHLEDWEHLASPTNPVTIKVIHQELARLAEIQNPSPGYETPIPPLSSDPPITEFPISELAEDFEADVKPLVSELPKIETISSSRPVAYDR